MPKLRKQRLYRLAHTAVKLSLIGHIPARDQQQLRLLSQQLSQMRPRIAQISKQYPSIHRLRQIKRRISVIEIARSQNGINNAATDVAQRVEFEAEKPSSTGFTKVCAIFSQQPNTSMSYWLANRDRLGICKVEFASACKSSRFKQPANDRAETVQASNPLLIRAQLREGRSEVITDKSIGLFERIYSEAALHHSYSDDFRIRECRSSIRRASPMSQFGMGFKEVIDKDVDFSHLIYNGSQTGRPPGVEMGFATSFYTPSGL